MKDASFTNADGDYLIVPQFGAQWRSLIRCLVMCCAMEVLISVLAHVLRVMTLQYLHAVLDALVA